MWWVLGVWFLGLVASWRSFVKSIVNALDDGEELEGFEKAVALVFGTCAAVLWPFTLLARHCFRSMQGTSLLMTAQQERRTAEIRAAQAEEELRKAKAFARKNKMPWPEGND